MGEKPERLCVDVVFTSLTVRELFISCTSSNKRMTISSMEKSGHFCGLFIMNGDGHMERPSSLATDPNIEHRSHESCQKQVVHSPIAIPPSIAEEGENDFTEVSQNQRPPVEHDNAPSGGTKEAMVTGSSHLLSRIESKQFVFPSQSNSVCTGDKKTSDVNVKSNPPQLASVMISHTNNPVNIPEELANLNNNMEESTPYTYQQLQDEQTHLEPLNAPVNDAQVSTVDSSSHSHLPPSKQSRHTTTSEHKASDEGTSHTLTAGLPLDKRRADQELLEKRRATVCCLLHGLEKDRNNYDEVFASEFEKFLSRQLNTVPLSTDKENPDYMWYIEDHLKKKQCPLFCARLWKFCTANNLCHLYKFADEAGLLLHSKHREDKVGSICTDFTDLESMEIIGRGGFGIVYLYTSPSGKKLAIKKETKHPLIDANPKLFSQILKLKNPHVIKTLEYLTHFDQDGKKSYLLVMPFMNQRGLDEQFKRKLGCGSVLAYMIKYPGQKKFIFRNFLEIFCQIFEALDYLKTQRLVHRDVKSSNIFMQQNCSCDSPLMCTCKEGNTIHCVLGDMNLLCNEGETAVITSEMWQRMGLEPAGTPRMKAPESYYKTGEGDSVIGHKSDVWSGCVTMINALIGREVNDIPDPQIGIFLRTATKTVENASKDIDSCSAMLESIINKYSSLLYGGNVNASTTGSTNPLALLTELQMLQEKLDNSGKTLKKVQAFQGGVPEARNKESPLAGILFTVHVANNLHWQCLKILPRVYGTLLWDCICNTLDIITEGVRFIPENRKDADEIVELLKPIKTKVT